MPTATAESLRATPDGKTFCEFFAGIGLVRMGLAGSGWECVYANDIDPNKRRMYEAAFGPSSHFHEGDVWDVADVLSRISGRPFLATASFPCVDLSLAGHYHGLGGSQSSAFFGFAAVISGMADRRPPVVLVENVPGFVTSDGGGDFRTAAVTLANLGYSLDAFVVDAERFVPQSRPRVFIVGVQRGYEPPGALRQDKKSWLADEWRQRVSCRPDVRPPSLARQVERIELPTGWLAFDLPPLPVRSVRLAEVIDLGDDQEWWGETEVERHREMMSDRHRALVAEMLDLGRTHVGTIYRRVRQGQQRAEVRFDGVAGCLRTPRGGSAKQIVIVLDDGRVRMRWMSPREYARLQGAGDFPLSGNRTRELFGFGDAVCVPVVEWIDAHVLTPIYEAACTRPAHVVTAPAARGRPSPAGRCTPRA